MVVALVSVSRLLWARMISSSLSYGPKARHAVAGPRAPGKGRCIWANFLEYGLGDGIYQAQLPLFNARMWWGGWVKKSAATVQAVQVQV